MFHMISLIGIMLFWLKLFPCTALPNIYEQRICFQFDKWLHVWIQPERSKGRQNDSAPLYGQSNAAYIYSPGYQYFGLYSLHSNIHDIHNS